MLISFVFEFTDTSPAALLGTVYFVQGTLELASLAIQFFLISIRLNPAEVRKALPSAVPRPNHTKRDVWYSGLVVVRYLAMVTSVNAQFCVCLGAWGVIYFQSSLQNSPKGLGCQSSCTVRAKRE